MNWKSMRMCLMACQTNTVWVGIQLVCFCHDCSFAWGLTEPWLMDQAREIAQGAPLALRMVSKHGFNPCE